MASLSNSSDVYADKLYLSLGEVGVVDLAETVAAKAEKAETYTISVMDMILDDKIDDAEFASVVSRVDSNIAEKANISDVYTKTEVNASALSTTSSLNSKADKSTTYTKSEVDANFALLVNSAPEALNQLNELANALANDANYATTVQNQLALKAPLASPSFTGNVSTSGDLEVLGLAEITGDAIIYGNTSVAGNLNVTGTTSFANPYWVALVINVTGGNPTIVRNGGRYAATSLARVSGQAVGIIQFDFPAHPQGLNYIVSASVVAGYATIITSVRTSTRIGISMRNTVNALFDSEVHVLILAY